MKKIIFLLIPFLILVLVVIFLFKQKSAPSVPVSTPESALPAPDLSSLNVAVSRFQGKIEKIENETLIVSGRPLFNSAAQATSAAVLAIPKLTMRVVISSDTRINRLPSLSPSAASSSALAKLSLQDLEVGQSVVISSTTDLRDLKTAEFTAKTVMILPPPQRR